MEDAIRTTDDMASADATADAPTVVPTPMSPDDLTDLRLKLRRGGYLPVPVLGSHVAMKAAGKRPMMKGWETVCASADETEITRWTKAQRNCTNTGLLCGDLVGVGVGPAVVCPQDAELLFDYLGMLFFDRCIPGHGVHVSLHRSGVTVGIGNFQCLHPQHHLLHRLGADFGGDWIVDSTGDVAMGLSLLYLQQ